MVPFSDIHMVSRTGTFEPSSSGFVMTSDDANFGGNFHAGSSSSTVFGTGFSEPCASSGTRVNLSKRNRPQKKQRNVRKSLAQVVGSRKRKVGAEEEELLVSTKNKCLKAIPNEGSLNL